jgi:hypothetical protein
MTYSRTLGKPRGLCQLPTARPRFNGASRALRVQTRILLFPERVGVPAVSRPQASRRETRVTHVVLTHAVEDVERWLGFKSERATVIGAMGATNVVDHVAADGSKNVAVSMDVADIGPLQAALASPPPELADGMQRHGVIPPVIAHVEK